jgi:hypothetical protein
MNRSLAAFLLGLLSFLLMMFIGESLARPIGDTMAMIVTFSSMAVYFFICQFTLSRGNADALRTDWRVMLALAAVPLASVVLMSLVEKGDVILAQGPGILLSTCAGTLAGAFAASRAARRAAGRR